MITWTQIVGEMQMTGRVEAAVVVNLTQHPRDAGMLPSVGLPLGQRATFAQTLASGDALHVYDFGSEYRAKLVRTTAAPLANVERALCESPGSSVLGAASIGALLGLALGRSKESALVGAMIGGFLGLGAVSVANAESSPATSEASRDAMRLAIEGMKARAQAEIAANSPKLPAPVAPPRLPPAASVGPATTMTRPVSAPAPTRRAKAKLPGRMTPTTKRTR